MEDNLDSQQTQRVSPEEAKVRHVAARTFRHFDLLNELGAGGMGTVWLARDRALNNSEVALKFLKSELASDPQAREDLVREVINNRSLNHPNILKAFNLEMDDTSADLSMRCAITMEFVKGDSLSRKLVARMRAATEKGETRGGAFEVEEIQKWVFQLCDAMQHAHEARDAKGHKRPIIHRDIKPANLMIHSSGDLKVCDFGIGCAVAETMSRLTNQATNSGTLPYMSPQQVAGKTPAPSHDIYSIGATIYELLTGKPPYFRGDTTMLIAQIKDEKNQPPSMEARRKELGFAGKPIPAIWEKTVAACLAKADEARPPSARAIRDMIEGRSSAARKSPLLLVAAAAVLLAAAGFGYWKFMRPAAPATATTAGSPPADPGAAGRSVPPTVATVTAAAPAANVPPAATGANVTPAAAPAASPVDILVNSGRITREEGAIVNAALGGGSGEREKDLASRLANGSLTPANWRDFSTQKMPAADETVGKLRPLLAAGQIGETEFGWLHAAMAGEKGKVESLLARQVLDDKSLTPEQWRLWSEITPLEKRDPNLEKLRPMLAAGSLTWPETLWLREALAGGKPAAEKSLAAGLVEDAQAAGVTPGQWRARTEFSYLLADSVVPAAANLPAAIDLPLGGAVKVRLLRLEAGTFLRGTPQGELGRRGQSEPTPERKEIAEPFYIGVYEITQSQYEAIMKGSPSYWRNHPDWPIDQVNWQAVMGKDGFLAKLNAALTTKYGGMLVADLPTEEEWEYACRAGTQTAFNSGKDITKPDHDPALDLLANYNLPAGGSPKSVGLYHPNAWGLYDMHGNVSEWTKNGYVRGGSWQSAASNTRAGWRQQTSPEAAGSNTIGFRLVLRLKKRSA